MPRGEARRATVLQPVEQKPHSQKDRQNEKSEDYVPDEGTREWHDIAKVMKGKNLQPRLLYPARISFRFYGEIKSFTDKQKLREFSTTKPALQQMLKELL